VVDESQYLTLLLLSFLFGTSIYAPPLLILFKKIRKLEKEKENMLKSLSEELNRVKENTKEALLNEWLESLREKDIRYKNELEVEIKFIYPFVKALGYSDDDIEIRRKITVQIGTQTLQIEADWVIYKNGKPFFVIEAKEPSVSLDSKKVKNQAKSYAFALGVSLYVITNGEFLHVYKWTPEEEILLLGLHITELALDWETIKNILGADTT